MDKVQKVYDFMQEAGYYFLLTVDDKGYPKGRAFTSKMIADGKLYLVTGKEKRVFQQLQAHPQVEIMAYQMKNQQYLRADATAVIVDDLDLVKQYLDKEPQVRGDFQGEAEPQVGLFYLKNAQGEILALDGTVKETFTF